MTPTIMAINFVGHHPIILAKLHTCAQVSSHVRAKPGQHPPTVAGASQGESAEIPGQTSEMSAGRFQTPGLLKPHAEIMLRWARF